MMLPDIGRMISTKIRQKLPESIIAALMISLRDVLVEIAEDQRQERHRQHGVDDARCPRCVP